MIEPSLEDVLISDYLNDLFSFLALLSRQLCSIDSYNLDFINSVPSLPPWLLCVCLCGLVQVAVFFGITHLDGSSKLPGNHNRKHNPSIFKASIPVTLETGQLLHERVEHLHFSLHAFWIEFGEFMPSLVNLLLVILITSRTRTDTYTGGSH